MRLSLILMTEIVLQFLVSLAKGEAGENLGAIFSPAPPEGLNPPEVIDSYQNIHPYTNVYNSNKEGYNNFQSSKNGYTNVNINKGGYNNFQNNKGGYSNFQNNKDGYNAENAVDYGSKCDSFHLCNREKFLECADDKCICENSLHRTYDNISQQCVNLVGQRCAHIPGPTACVPHAECNILGKCGCKSGYSATSKKMCRVDYGKHCQANQCNSEKGLACKEGKCVCLDSMYVWIPFQKRCVDPREFLINVLRMIGTTLGATPPGQIVNIVTGGALNSIG